MEDWTCFFSRNDYIIAVSSGIDIREYSIMSIIETRYEHIVLDEDKVPIIARTNMKVVELVVERMAYGWSPEELYFQHPYLSLGQIHSALAY